MRRISLENVQIEHYLPQHPQSENYDPALTIDYRNMLAVCSGVLSEGEHFQAKTDGRYAEFAGVIIWYLKRQIARV